MPVQSSTDRGVREGRFACEPANLIVSLQGGEGGYKFIRVVCVGCQREANIDIRPKRLSTLVHAGVQASPPRWDGRRFVVKG